MSTVAYAPARPRTEQQPRPARHVEIVPDRALRRARPKPLYAVIAIGGLFALFIAQLLLSIAVSDGAYRIAGLQDQKVEADREHQNLTERIDVLASTQNLAARASALGMVMSSGTPAFLDLAAGEVVGTSTAVSASSSAGGTIANALLPESEMEDGAEEVATKNAAAGNASTEQGGTAASGTETERPALESGAPSATADTPPVVSADGLPTPSTH
jgi:hypothetical protein